MNVTSAAFEKISSAIAVPDGQIDVAYFAIKSFSALSLRFRLRFGYSAKNDDWRHMRGNGRISR
jgi:hypothetical protein